MKTLLPRSGEKVSNIMGNKLLFMCSTDTVAVNHWQKLLKYLWKISAPMIHERKRSNENKFLHFLARYTHEHDANLLNYHSYRCSDPCIIYVGVTPRKYAKGSFFFKLANVAKLFGIVLPFAYLFEKYSIDFTARIFRFNFSLSFA